MAADRAAASRTDLAKCQTANNAKLQGKHLPHRPKEAPQAVFAQSTARAAKKHSIFHHIFKSR